MALEGSEGVLTLRSPPKGLWNHQHAPGTGLFLPHTPLLFSQCLPQRQGTLLRKGQVSLVRLALFGIRRLRCLLCHEGGC